MSHQPLVSVCTPVYNGERFLSDCIAGVLAQRYENFEYIIIDNASTDGTPEIIEDFRKKDPRVKVFRNPETIFVIDNLMACAARCSSESTWIKYALADDYLFPNTLEEMVRVGEMSPDIGLVSAYRMYGTRWTNLGLPFDQSVFKGSEILKRQLLRKLHVCSSSPNTILYRKSAFDAVGGLDRRYLHADTELALRLLDRHDLGFAHCVFTKTGLHDARQEKGSVYSGLVIREYLDFGFRRLGEYRSVSFTANEREELADYYTRSISEFLGKKMAHLDAKNIGLMVNSCPDEVRSRVFGALVKRPGPLMKGFVRELFGGKKERV
jgi:glycosyltransferase involved in cell wall biosynthesis